jgi:hypothetical protein
MGTVVYLSEKSPKHSGLQGIALETYLHTRPFSEDGINEWMESTRLAQSKGTGTAPIRDIQGNQSGIDENNERSQ